MRLYVARQIHENTVVVYTVCSASSMSQLQISLVSSPTPAATLHTLHLLLLHSGIQRYGKA